MSLEQMMSVHTDPLSAYWEVQSYSPIVASLADFSSMSLAQDGRVLNTFQLVMPRPCRVVRIGVTWRASAASGFGGIITAMARKNGAVGNAYLQTATAAVGGIEYFWLNGTLPINQSIEFNAGDRLSTTIQWIANSPFEDALNAEARMNVGFTLR